MEKTMARWECIVCGLIYDERKGWPEDSIAPGTKWEDVPDDWMCPDCGVGKDDFERVPGSEHDALPEASESDVTPPALADQGTSATDSATLSATTDITPTNAPSEQAQLPANQHVVIIGSGLAGVGLVREIRRHSPTVAITVVTADGGEIYSKPLLSTGYTKGLNYDKLAIQSAHAFAQQFNVSVRSRTRVTAIDSAAKMLTLEQGDPLSFDSLVLATGAAVITPPLTGDGAGDVLSINDLDDYAHFQALVETRQVKKVAIIGSGLIGCEFTNDLLNGGFVTESVDPMGWCLPTLLPEACGLAVQTALESAGATFHFGKLATSVQRVGDAYRMNLNDGTAIDADIVLSAVGVRPSTALAERAGIDVNRGIKTDAFLRTSVEGIFALGDCAEVEGHVLVYVAPLSAAARALGATLTGQTTAVHYPAMPVAIKTPACPVTVAPPPRDAQGAWHIEGESPNLKASFKDPNGHLLGYALTGDAVKEKSALTKRLPPVLE